LNDQLKHIIPLFLVFVCISVIAYASQPNEVPGETMARMMKLGNEIATPNENHAFLSKLTGEWETTASLMDMESTPGTASYKMILGNRYLDGMHFGTLMGTPFEGRLTIGYDNYKHKFVSSYIDDLGTSIRPAEGMLNRTGTVLSLWGPMDEWMTDEHDKPVLYKYTLIDENQFVF
jgi:hypothetical protein